MFSYKKSFNVIFISLYGKYNKMAAPAQTYPVCDKIKRMTVVKEMSERATDIEMRRVLSDCKLGNKCF